LPAILIVLYKAAELRSRAPSCEEDIRSVDEKAYGPGGYGDDAGDDGGLGRNSFGDPVRRFV
jgi:hypothetical protein